jgi:hypothetical protein
MAHALLISSALAHADLHPAVRAALDELCHAAAPPLTEPDAPVRLADLPAVWREHLRFYDALVPTTGPDLERADWARLLTLVARGLEHAYRFAGLFAQAERGPAPEDLAGAPVLTQWSPALARRSDLVLAGHVTGHPRLTGPWICTSPLVALDARAGWARSWSRWYRLGEPMAPEHGLGFWQAGVPVRLIATDDVAVGQHLAALRERVSRVLEPLAEPGSEGHD